ncbi:SF01-like protein [Mya arenaria]|uniref:Branchpoint-bridging protein n=1 Tax=Mya arenaria TaxID=6604 RepID=A0ABY7DI15_MYAAR|nr:SF01-like protein [Mya arenaria]
MSNHQKRPMDFGSSPSWGGGVGTNGKDDGGGSERKRKRKSRWGAEETVEKTVIPGMPTILPANLSKDQEKQYLCKLTRFQKKVHLQIEEISRRLRTGDLGIPANPEDRSPSPEPIYNNEGKRLNTREYRTRKKLEEDRHRLVQEASGLNTEYKPPADYKPPVVRVNDKVMIPQEEHPDINFVGLLIGPRGNTLKTLEKETGAKIIIRGKGSVKDGKIGRKDGQPLPGEDEPLHAYVTANNPENVLKAVEKIKSIIKESVEVPEGQNDLRKQQLRELALLNGTLRENDGLAKLRQIQQAQSIVTNTIICTNCGGAGHLGKDCKQSRPGDTYRSMIQQESSTDKAKMDSEYMSLMAELGEGPPPPKQNTGSHYRQQMPQSQPHISRFNQPPPNPMGGFNNFPPTNRGPPPSLLSLNNTRPPQNMYQQPQQTYQHQNMQGIHPPGQMQGPPPMQQQMGHQGQFQPHSSVPQPVAPPVQPQHGMPMGGPGQVAPVPPPSSMNMAAPVPPPAPWSSAAASHMNTNPIQSMAMGAVPPPPPSSQGSWQAAPPPPPVSMGQMPWQQAQSMGQPTSVAPPPPPPSSGQGFNMPPPPPSGYDPNQMSGVNQLIVAPPPPPPN